MRTLVIGAGLIGVTAAYFLRQRGEDVVVVDRAEGAGREASFANGSLLTPSMAEPWNAPGSWRVLLASLGRSDSPMQLRLHAVPSLARWGTQFLLNSSPSRYQRNSLSNLRLAMHSVQMMQVLRDSTGIEYGQALAGSLRIFRSDAAFAAARMRAAELRELGLAVTELSPAQTAHLEPAVEPIANELAGAIHYRSDETGDAFRFCEALAELGKQQGVEFHFGITVTSLEHRGDRVIAALSTLRRFEADRFVIAAGSHSTTLLRELGLRLPVQPVKGYSITVTPPTSATPLRTPLIDDHLHAVLVPLAGNIRVAGTAEFTGFDRSLSDARIRNLTGLLKEVLPRVSFDVTAARPWCGLRAMSADGVPLIGRTPFANLLISTGHGHLGWTMAAGSAQLLADIQCGSPPPLDPAPYDPLRFALT